LREDEDPKVRHITWLNQDLSSFQHGVGLETSSAHSLVWKGCLMVKTEPIHGEIENISISFPECSNHSKLLHSHVLMLYYTLAF
jgi:hypothetical protein